ncbi:unnamed protein product [Rhodiola kirilowii]
MANCYASQLQRCYPHSPASHSLAQTIHAHMVTSGFSPHSHILNRLIDVYAKSSNMAYARNLFDKIPYPDVVSRTTLISGYSDAGDIKSAREVFDLTPFGLRDTVFYNAMVKAFSHNQDGHAAVNVFRDMLRLGFKPDFFTFTSALATVSMIAEEHKMCQQMHCAVVKCGAGNVTSVSNALISIYVKWACLPLVPDSFFLMGQARKLFDEMNERDEITWTTMIAGFVKNDDLVSAQEFFDQMDDKLTVAWNAMISGYVQHGCFDKALEMFRNMQSAGMELDEFTFTSILSACTNVGLLQHGKAVHAHVLRTKMKPTPDFEQSVNNSLLTFYWRAGKVDQAHHVFESMPRRDLVSWNAVLSEYVKAGRIDEAKTCFMMMPQKCGLSWTVMISGLAQSGYGEEGLKLFHQMKAEGFEPCDYAFAGAIISCSALGALKHGQQLHSQLVRLGFDVSLSAGNSLITMYARCGVVEAAKCLFFSMPYLDSVSWNAMIAALGQHGQGTAAIELYEQMLSEKISPDRITFLTILSACSHKGLVEEGQRYFDSMSASFGIIPGEDHYARMIDLFCRAGKFSEANHLIDSMPLKPGIPIWEAVLAGCRVHGNMDLGIRAAERLFELRPEHDGTYILLSNMYATVGRWDDMARVRNFMRERGVKKEPGCSWIEVDQMVHAFLVGDTKHPEMTAIFEYLQELGPEIIKLGYVPDTQLVLHKIDSDQKEQVLSTHSEKLAVAFGLLKLPPSAPIRIFKNLRICGDCHKWMKLVSQFVKREIIVRDGRRFHHFTDGVCSCGDYW